MDFLLLVFAFRYLQKHEQTKNLYPQWVDLFFKGFIAALILFIIELTLDAPDVFLRWFAHVVNFAIVYAAFNRQEFSPIKVYVNAFLPIVVVYFVQDVTKLISTEFYNSYETWFDTAALFAWIWLFAQYFINRKQRKALEMERIKAAQQELQFKQSEKLKDALEIQVAERTAEITAQKEELLKTLNELKSTQSQLIHAEKMASLGELTAGIAHEIQNPLNFVNNFSEVSSELIDEVEEERAKTGDERDEKLVSEILADLKDNLLKINHHGKRADAIVKGMLEHSRSNSGEKVLTDINALADEYIRLSYHGLRAKDKSFNADFKLNLDPELPKIPVIPQDIGRVLLNLINNAFYAVNEKAKEKAKEAQEAFQPVVTVTTSVSQNKSGLSEALIVVQDNGHGIPDHIKDKIFQPFFTTKPTGAGTGLGLSLSYDIVNAHGGELKIESEPGEGSSFSIFLPIQE
ncbi:sensor histidine kinase [Algoriphagus pacificus]|uniref:histidine kinase n=1 Tax=Algoriphagus pacificus TaxID=2811234 RepID=A0ABS3CDI5_9BACT|nr:ATP-binding protein [Algoriphagus pacificus]MBN7814604.1 histidine kinase [Algoriphagus pacificus]